MCEKILVDDPYHLAVAYAAFYVLFLSVSIHNLACQCNLTLPFNASPSIQYVQTYNHEAPAFLLVGAFQVLSACDSLSAHGSAVEMTCTECLHATSRKHFMLVVCR